MGFEAGGILATIVHNTLVNTSETSKAKIALGFYFGVPAIMAALASEGTRGFHEEARFSVGLTPDRGEVCRPFPRCDFGR